MNLFQIFSKIADKRNNNIKYLGDIHQLFSNDCDDNGIRKYGYNSGVLTRIIFQDFIKPTSLKLIRAIFKNINALL